jgi:hypothetical protein
VVHFLIFVSWYLNFTASDYYQLDDLLNPEERVVRKKVRECMEKEIAPIMTEVYFSCYSYCCFYFQKMETIALFVNTILKFWNGIVQMQIISSTFVFSSIGRRPSFHFMLFQNLVPCIFLVAQSR